MTTNGGTSKLLSVITVVKEDPEGLLHTIRSVAEQRGRYQHIIVDGGSTSKEMMRVLDSAQDMGLTFVSEPDQGCYDAMNKGAKLAVGDSLAFLNAGDEYATPEAVDLLLSLTEQAPWGYGALELVKPQGTRVYRFDPYRRRLHRLGIRWVPHPSSVIRRPVLYMLGGFDINFGHAADQALFLKLSRNHMPSTTREVISRFHLGGWSTQRVDLADSEFHQIRMYNSEPLLGSAPVDSAVTSGLALARRAARSILSR